MKRAKIIRTDKYLFRLTKLALLSVRMSDKMMIKIFLRPLTEVFY